MTTKFSPLLVAMTVAGLEAILLLGLIFGKDQIGPWGSWLSGILTPAIVIAALLSYRSSEKARMETARADVLTAEINQRSAFLAHIDRLERHLSYKGTCALLQARVSNADHEMHLRNEMGGY